MSGEARLLRSSEPPLSAEAALERVAARAADADRGAITLGDDLAELHRTGLLAEVVAAAGPGGDALRATTLLRRIGRASLPVGRLVEGHANALKLIELYGTAGQRARARSEAAEGLVYGVWGADGTPPLSIEEGTDGQRLHGTKAFCSGLGLVGRAVVTAPGAAGQVQLLLVDVDDAARADASSWRVSGMRATASGRYRFDGCRAERLGCPGDYLREPHFEGGVWRYCALHTGGLEALAEAVRGHIRRRAQGDDPHQARRLARIVLAAETARLWVEAAAIAVERPEAGALAVTRALLAREAIETACQDGMAVTDRALGTAGFAEGTPAERIRRDLGLFLRQANLDGKLMAAARGLTGAAGVVGEMW